MVSLILIPGSADGGTEEKWDWSDDEDVQGKLSPLSAQYGMVDGRAFELWRILLNKEHDWLELCKSLWNPNNWRTEMNDGNLLNLESWH